MSSSKIYKRCHSIKTTQMTLSNCSSKCETNNIIRNQIKQLQVKLQCFKQIIERKKLNHKNLKQQKIERYQKTISNLINTYMQQHRLNQQLQKMLSKENKRTETTTKSSPILLSQNSSTHELFRFLH